MFHLYNPSPAVLARDPSQHYPVGQYRDPDSGRTVTVTHTQAYDAATQVNHILRHSQKEGEQEQISSLEMRVFFPQEMDALLHYNGYKLVAKYGDWDEAPFTSDSRLQLVVCQAL